MAKERFTDKEKCLMEICNCKHINGIVLADEDMMRNIGMPYFQKMADDYAAQHPEDTNARQISQNGLKYDSLERASGAMRIYIQALSINNGEWEQMCEKLSQDERAVMTGATGANYLERDKGLYGYTKTPEDVQTYESLTSYEFMKEDIKKIMNSEDIGFHFDDEHRLIGDYDKFPIGRPCSNHQAGLPEPGEDLYQEPLWNENEIQDYSEKSKNLQTAKTGREVPSTFEEMEKAEDNTEQKKEDSPAD